MANIINLNFKRVFESYGLKSKDVAQNMGVDPASISATINTIPKIETIEKIAAAVGCSPMEFFDEYVELKKKYQQLALKYAECVGSDNELSSSKMACPHCGKTVKVILR